MSDMEIIAVLIAAFMGLVLYFGPCIICAVVARKTGRSALLYLLMSIIFSPILGFVVLLILVIAEPREYSITSLDNC